MIVGYARVSTDGQTLDAQHTAQLVDDFDAVHPAGVLDFPQSVIQMGSTTGTSVHRSIADDTRVERDEGKTRFGLRY
jgi:DNA invertase Pin-like site-specific DNA recombinase